MHEASSSAPPWDIESDWSATIRDRVILYTVHCRMVEHRAVAGDRGEQQGYYGAYAANDWDNTSFPVLGRLAVTASVPGALPVRQVLSPRGEMVWDERILALMQRAGEDHVRWDYEALDTPTVWRCVFLSRDSGLHNPGRSDMARQWRHRHFGPGDSIDVTVGPGLMALMVYLDARLERGDAISDPYSGSHLHQPGAVIREGVSSGDVYVLDVIRGAL